MIQIIIYILCFAAKVWPLRKQWTAPRLHGPSYFLGVRVGPDFYSGAGSTWLRWFRLLLVSPYAIELSCFLALVSSGGAAYLPALLFAGGAATSISTVAVFQVFRRKARRFEAPAGALRDAAVALPLAPRRLRDYTNPAAEIAIVLATLLAIVLSALVWRDSGRSFVAVFTFPALLLYAQVGALLVKDALVFWRSAAPAENAAAYSELREHARRLFMTICDWVRGACAGMLLSYAALLLARDAQTDMRVRLAILAPVMALVAIMTVSLLRSSSRLWDMAARLRPAQPARLVTGDRPRAGLWFYDPDNPALVASGRLGFALNLANRRAYLYACYVAALLAFVLWRQGQ